MPNITTCPKCSKCYEEVSEEMANSSERLCRACYERRKARHAALLGVGLPTVDSRRREDGPGSAGSSAGAAEGAGESRAAAPMRINVATREALVPEPPARAAPNSTIGDKQQHPHPSTFVGRDPAQEAPPDDDRCCRRPHRRVVRGYVRVLEDQKFHDHGTFITLPRGSVLERLEPNERDARAFAEQRKRDGRQLVVVQWKNDTVWLYANTIEEATLTDWECQREM